MASQSLMLRKANLLAIIVLVCLAVLGAAGDASEQAAKTDAAASEGIVRPDGLKWAPFLETVLVAPVSGDPSQPGAFVLRVRFPAGVTIPPHRHPADENLTGLGGKLAVGMGDVFDSSKLIVMERGDFIQMREDESLYKGADRRNRSVVRHGPVCNHFRKSGGRPTAEKVAQTIHLGGDCWAALQGTAIQKPEPFTPRDHS